MWLLPAELRLDRALRRPLTPSPAASISCSSDVGKAPLNEEWREEWREVDGEEELEAPPRRDGNVSVGGWSVVVLASSCDSAGAMTRRPLENRDDKPGEGVEAGEEAALKGDPTTEEPELSGGTNGDVGESMSSGGART